jgi:starvation-inducible DNA-binding protein
MPKGPFASMNGQPIIRPSDFMTLHPTRNDLSLETRTRITGLLNDRLADLVDLAMQAKQAHWNVKGSSFIALHQLFDDVAGALPPHIDELAERIVALGGVAEGTIGSIASRTSLPPYPTDITAGRDHVEMLSEAIAEAGKRIRSDIAKASGLGDEGTTDLLTGISRDLDKYLWFVESHLQGD